MQPLAHTTKLPPKQLWHHYEQNEVSREETSLPFEFEAGGV